SIKMIDQFKILNPQALISIFGEIPKLEESELLDVRLKRDGPTLVIQLIVNVKINMYIFACLSMYKINHFLC
ncbi:Imm50 family immunity protein, partial [Bacillus thuringiensis]|nr:Imm50 family immunity protein [Bacillus thuringiensis]